MATTMPPPLVLVTSLEPAPRPVVVIDGESHQLAAPEDLTVVQIKDLERLGLLLMKADTTPEEAAEADRRLLSVCRAILPASDEVHARLKPFQRLQVLTSFTTLRPRQTTSPKAGAPARPSTGGTSRRGSNGSTAAPRRRG